MGLHYPDTMGGQRTYYAKQINTQDYRAELARLWKENLAPEQTLSAEGVTERMRWFHDDNPAGQARTWMGFYGPNEEIIGSASFYPRQLRVAGQAMKAGILGDFSVVKRHRIGGGAMTIQREIAAGSRQAGVDLLKAFPNTASFPIFQRLGYAKVASAAMWVKPLTFRDKLETLTHAPEQEQKDVVHGVVERVVERVASVIPHPRWQALWHHKGASAWVEERLLTAVKTPDHGLVRAAMQVADQAIASVDTARLLARRRSVEGALVNRADSRFDALWARSRVGWIVGERSSAYLNWRYADFKTNTYRFFCMTDKRTGDLIGYVVYSIMANRAIVADLFCDDFESGLDLLLLKFCQFAREQGHVAVCVLYAGAKSVGERMRALGFFLRPLPKAVGQRWLVVHLDENFPEGLRALVLDPENWFMPDGELDA